MNRETILSELDGLQNVARLTFSAPLPGSDVSRISLRPVALRGVSCWQVESQRGAQVFHENGTAAEMLQRLPMLLENYRQLCAVRPGETVTYSHYGKKWKRSATANALLGESGGHDRDKRYLLAEGEPVPALVDLGIFTAEYRLVAARRDKYKQINRFLELVDDNLRGFSGSRLRIMDFGCGKSYLTFILYYYLVERRGLDAEITGYDIKADVVEHCNRIAEKYGYTKLRFVLGDVSRDTVDSSGIDMLVTLHACDTATDYALDYAIRNHIPRILSVPCCQHEINLSIHKGGELDIFMRHGLLQERMCALLTDALRAELLRRCGYEVDVIEFVDLTHTPKNLMLRGVLRRGGALPQLDELEALAARYGFEQTLLRLTAQRLKDTPRLPRPE